MFPGKNSASVNPTASTTINTISRISEAGELFAVGCGVVVGGVEGVEGVVLDGVLGSGVG